MKRKHERFSVETCQDNHGCRFSRNSRGASCKASPTKLSILLNRIPLGSLGYRYPAETALAQIILELAYIAAYPLFIVYSALMLQLGVWTWLYISVCLAPPIILWYVTLRKRAINYIKLRLASRPVWNPDTINKYMALINRD